jgi:hypothetical protein
MLENKLEEIGEKFPEREKMGTRSASWECKRMETVSCNKDFGKLACRKWAATQNYESGSHGKK